MEQNKYLVFQNAIRGAAGSLGMKAVTMNMEHFKFLSAVTESQN